MQTLKLLAEKWQPRGVVIRLHLFDFPSARLPGGALSCKLSKPQRQCIEQAWPIAEQSASAGFGSCRGNRPRRAVMACVLTRREDGVFEGKTGKTVEIDLQSERPLKLVRLAYAGKDDGEPPFTFKIVSGPQKLLIVALGAGKAVQLMRIVEDPGGDACHLRNFFWSPTNFFTSLDIEGV